MSGVTIRSHSRAGLFAYNQAVCYGYFKVPQVLGGGGVCCRLPPGSLCMCIWHCLLTRVALQKHWPLLHTLGYPQGRAVSLASVSLGEIPLKLARFLFCQIWFGKCKPLFVLCFYESACFTSCACKWLMIRQKQLIDSQSLAALPSSSGSKRMFLSEFCTLWGENCLLSSYIPQARGT